MTQENFIFWLKGYLEGQTGKPVSEESLKLIKEKLSQVENTIKNYPPLPAYPFDDQDKWPKSPEIID